MNAFIVKGTSTTPLDILLWDSTDVFDWIIMCFVLFGGSSKGFTMLWLLGIEKEINSDLLGYSVLYLEEMLFLQVFQLQMIHNLIIIDQIYSTR